MDSPRTVCVVCVFLLGNLNNIQIVVLGVVPEIAMDFDSKEVEPKLMRGLPMDSPRTVFGAVKKNSPSLLVGPKMSMCYLHKICLK